MDMLKAAGKLKAGEIMNSLKSLFFQVHLKSYFEPRKNNPSHWPSSQIKLSNRPVHMQTGHQLPGMCFETEQKGPQNNGLILFYLFWLSHRWEHRKSQALRVSIVSYASACSCDTKNSIINF